MKILRALLCAAIPALLCAPALAQDGLGGGAFVAEGADGAIYLSDGGLLRADDAGVTRISDDSVACLQWADGALYFVHYTDMGDEGRTAELCRLSADTEAVTVIGGARYVGTDYEYDEGYTQLTEYTTRYGYGEVCAYGDFIYYIGDDETPGTYHTECIDWAGVPGHTSFCTSYESCAAIYRVDKNGENPVMLIGGLGNGGNVHMTIADDVITVSSCWQNGLYAYDFASFCRYDMDGTLIESVGTSTSELHDSIYKTDQSFTANVEALHTDGERVYASFGDSEGDFASSRFADVTQEDDTLIYEAFFVPAAVCDCGIAYITSAVQNVWWEDSMQNTLTVNLRDSNGDTCLAYIPESHAQYDVRLCAAGDWVYVRLGEDVMRVAFAGGTPQLLAADGFADCADFLPENCPSVSEASEETEEDDEYMYLLPYSGKTLFTAEDLSIYDAELLASMRKEIYARHGCIFESDADNAYFAGAPWYTPDPDFSEDDFNDIERANIAVIDSLLG